MDTILNVTPWDYVIPSIAFGMMIAGGFAWIWTYFSWRSERPKPFVGPDDYRKICHDCKVRR